MIRIALIGIVGLMIVSCHTPKKMVEEQPKIEPQKETNQVPADKNEVFYLGLVQILDCGVTIQITSGETKNTVSPINLDSKLQVNNLRLKLKFKQVDERASGCMEFQAIEITEVFAVR
ncbi:hypothetical protein [Fluviicola sp.]|uniref:hypothetical protein n=1 Tax=Fluviicola sp. TaxID=1917219 RepID=UPI003D2802FC